MKAFVVLQDQSGNQALCLPLNPDNVAVVEQVRDLFLAKATPPASNPAPNPEPAPKPVKRSVRHSLGFRKAAVLRWAHSSMTVLQVAQDLNVPYSTMDHWIRQEYGTTDRTRIQISVSVEA